MFDFRGLRLDWFRLQVLLPFGNLFKTFILKFKVEVGTLQPHYKMPHYNLAFNITWPIVAPKLLFFARSVSVVSNIIRPHFWVRLLLWAPNIA